MAEDVKAVLATYLIPTHTSVTGTLGQGTSICCSLFCSQKFGPYEG